MLSYILLLGAAATSVSAQSGVAFPGVTATGTMGVTNPPAPTLGTAINQTSYSRLLSINSVDDFCLFAPPTEGAIADTETIEVAWCTLARNNARVIPDGTLQGVSFLRTDLYVQVMAYGDFTKLNIPQGDEGGELDPHGAYGDGNPKGGNVTTNVTGSDINVAEWMQYISSNQFCLRACINANSTYSAAAECWHELDEMGCEFVMPGNYNFNGTYETCDADAALPPGWYPEGVTNGVTSFSSFAQYFTGAYTVGSSTVDYTVGDTVTPASAAFTPASSNCVTVSTVSNGIALASLGYSGSAGGSSPTSAPSGSGRTGASRSGSGASSSSTGGASGGSSNSNGAAGVSRDMQLMGVAVGAVVAMISGVAVLL